jgi:O-antigen ligase
MGVLNKPSNFEGFIKIIILGVIVSAMMGILLATEAIGFIDIPISSYLESQGAGFGIFEGTLEYNLYNMATIIFGFPFLLALIFLPKDLSIVNKFWNYLALFALMLALITLLISGRRAFWVISLASPLIIFAIFRISGLANSIKIKQLFFVFVLMTTIFLIGSMVFKLNFESIIYDVLAGFDFSDSSNLSASIRAEQFYALLHGWMDHPLLGSGHGAAALGSIQRDERAWAYELSYLALLFQIGLIGFLIYFSALLWTFIKSVRIVRTNPKSAAMILPLLSGLSCFLIANATNPYLAKFDYLWTIFLPVGILNAYLLRTSFGHNPR